MSNPEAAAVAPRRVPENVEAEQCLLGSILLDPRALDAALDLMAPHDFYWRKHQLIFQAMLDLSERQEGIDQVTLSDLLLVRGQLEPVGGSAYLAELVQVVSTAANVRTHAKIIHETAQLRQLIQICTRLLDQAYERTETPARIIETLEQSVFKLLQGETDDGFQPIGKALQATLDYLQKLSERDTHLTGITTGFRDLDDLTAGWQDTDLIIIAARPSMGKTSLALSTALAAAAAGKSVGFFSLEMSRQQLLLRLLSMGARIDSHVMRTGRLAKSDWWKVAEVVQGLENQPIYISDKGITTMAQIRSRARRLKAERGVDLLIVDYLQLLSGSPEADSRQEEISEISRALKALAKELQIPVIALSQLSRRVEERKPPTPILADLRESGAIEQDADLVVFIYREEVYDQKTDKRGEAELIIGKQRNGPIGDCKLTFLKAFARFEDCYRPPTLYEQRHLEAPAD